MAAIPSGLLPYPSTATLPQSSNPGGCKKGKNGSQKIDRRTWIWSGGWDSSEIFTAGFNYVVVQGEDTLCVVTGDKNVVNQRKWNYWMGALIVEIRGNDLYGCRKSKPGEYLGMFPMNEDLRPFAAVNVVLGTKEVNTETSDEASGVGQNEIEAIDFLMRKVQNASGFNYQETVQIALSALVRLFKIDLMACKLKVCVQRKGAHSCVQLSGKEIGEHLEMIKNQQDVHAS